MGTQSDFRVKKNLIVGDGTISSDSGNLVLRRDFDDTIYNQITLGDDTYKITLDNSDRFYIDGDGKVGIGTTTPSDALHIRAASDHPLVIENTTNAGFVGIQFSDNAGGSYAQKGELRFNHADTESDGSGASFHFTSTESLNVIMPRLSIKHTLPSNDATTLSGAEVFKVDSIDDQSTSGGPGYQIRLEATNDHNAANYERVFMGDGGGMRVKNKFGNWGFSEWWLAGNADGFKPIMGLGAGGSTGAGAAQDGILTLYSTTSAWATNTWSPSNNTAKVVLDAGGDSYFTGGNVGLGTTSPKKNLHISDGSTSGITGGTTAALLITDDSNPRIYFEALDEASGNRVYDIAVGNDSFDGFSFNSLNDAASVYENQNILTIHADGNVGIGTGTATPDRALEVNAGTENLGGIEITGTGVNTSLTINNTGTNGGEYRMSVTSGNHGDGSNKLIFQDGTVARMTLNSSGNLGIGVTAPSTRLHLKTDNDSNFPQLKIDNAGTGDAALFFTAGSVWSMGVDNSDSDKFKISQDNSNAYLHTNTMFTIDTSGRVGIGASSPGYMLDIQGGSAHIRLKDTSDNDDMYLTYHGSDGNEYGFIGYNGTAVFQIRSAQGKVINLGGHANTKVGVTTADMTFTPTALLHVNGSFKATTKSFDIEHPTKEGMRLHHGVLEGPEHGVYIRGHQVGDTIELPDYWLGLVDEETITVQLTANKFPQSLFVKDINEERILIDRLMGEGEGAIDCFYFIQAERKDVDKMEVEYDSVH